MYNTVGALYLRPSPAVSTERDLSCRRGHGLWQPVRGPHLASSPPRRLALTRHRAAYPFALAATSAALPGLAGSCELEEAGRQNRTELSKTRSL